MIDISNEYLLTKKNKANNMISFESISEKQEESSNSSVKNSRLGKCKVSIKNSKTNLINNDISKDGINISNISINKPIRRDTKYGALFQKEKNLKDNHKLEEMIKEREMKIRQFKRRETKKKTNQLFLKRISFQQDNNNLSYYNQIKNNEENRRNSKNNIAINPLGKTTLKDINKRLSSNKINTLSGLCSNKTTITGNKSVNITHTDSFLDMKYFNNKKLKRTMLNKGNINLHVQKNMHSSNLFEKLKESYLYEKSEAVLFKIKICYAILAIFSFLSISLEITDVVLFNRRSEEYLTEKYKINVINDTNVEHYYFIQERKITYQENVIRVFNFIFSLICFFIHIIVHFIKNNFEKKSKKKNKYNNNY